MSTILVSDCQLLELPCDVICGACVCIPVGVDTIGIGDHVGPLLLMFIFIIVSMPTITSTSWMMLVANLTFWIISNLLTLLLWTTAATTAAAISTRWSWGGAPASAAPPVVAAPAASAVAVPAPPVG